MTLKLDPRVKTPAEGLARQFVLSMQFYEGMQQARTMTAQIQKLRAELQSRGELAKEAALKNATSALERKLFTRAGAAVGGRGRRSGGSREATFARVQGEMGQLLNLLQCADATPTSQVVAACGFPMPLRRPCQ